jgi:hypothetical protein
MPPSVDQIVRENSTKSENKRISEAFAVLEKAIQKVQETGGVTVAGNRTLEDALAEAARILGT